MAKQCISELREGQPVDSLFSVKYKKSATAYAKGYKFTAGLSDMTGEIELKFWGGMDKDSVQKVYDSFKEDDIIHVVGTVSRYERVEIHVNEGRGIIEKAREYSSGDFVPSTKQDMGRMMDEVNSAVSSVRNPHIKALLDAFFKDPSFVEEFKRTPAGITMHHNYIGGLLEHTIHVLEICKSLLSIHPQLDHDLMIAGALLHDIGKTREFRVTTNIKQTPDGMLRGHITIGQEMLLEKIGSISGFPEELKMKIAHIMLSHHGNGECGSPVAPAFAEAEAVHYADECDAKLDQHITTKESPMTEDFRVYSRKLGRPVYVK